MTPHIAVLGAPGVGKRSLVAALVGNSSCNEPSATPWSIHTKYYTADVALQVQAIGRDSSQPDRSSSSAPEFDAEAVVLVFDATRPESFSAIQAWASGKAEATEGAGVRLVVCTHVDLCPWSPPAAHASSAPKSVSPDPSPPASNQQPSSRPQWLVEAMDWCAQECYEYVECSATDAAVDAQLRLEGDLQGIARVTEALEVRAHGAKSILLLIVSEVACLHQTRACMRM